MRNIRPIIMIIEPGIESWQKESVLEGVREILEIAGIYDKIEIKEDNNIELYLKEGFKQERNGQLNADLIIGLIENEIIQLHMSLSPLYYKILIFKKDLYSDKTIFVIGLGQEGSGAVISIYRFLKLKYSDQKECIKTEVIHELGHVFGLIPDSRKFKVENSLGKHCKNRCTMRQGLNVPDDWIRISNERLQFGTFCDICLKDLRAFMSDE